MTGLQECILQGFIKAAGEVLGLDSSLLEAYIREGRIKVAPTPSPAMGDYGIPLHAVLKSYPREKWGELGELIAERLLGYLPSECRARKTLFTNGYLNIEVDYSTLFSSFMESLLSGKMEEELKGVGAGRIIVVEHTSANPVHPLHLGSARNSVLGDTYARLLKRLGFNTIRLFYVNDLGRQIAVLAYGVSKLKALGVEPRRELKVDHWYGVVYALTNILIEEDKLAGKLADLKVELKRILEDIAGSLREKLSGEDPEAVRIYSKITLVLRKLELKHDTLKLLRVVREVSGSQHPAVSPYRARLLDVITRYMELHEEYAGYVKARNKLCRDYHVECVSLLKAFEGYEKAEEEIAELMRRAEKGDPEARSLLRDVSREVLRGFKETLSSLNILFDGFDHESSDEILELSKRIVDNVAGSRYARIVDGAVEVDLNKAGEEHEYVRRLFYPDEPGRFIIRRRDGTTLYVTRDIAYTLMKFTRYNADKVYNVIAVEQARAQKQLKAILHLLGYQREAENLIHFSYEMVHLKGMRMSGRRGIYYTIDELLADIVDFMIEKQLESSEEKRKATGESSDLEEAARMLAVNNLRALLLSVEPSKVLTFDLKNARAFEHGVIVTYSLVRAQSVLRKLWGFEPLDNPGELRARGMEVLSNLKGRELEFGVEERQLVEELLDYMKVLREAYEYMRPDKILVYAVNLALGFNKLYEKHRIINEPDPVKRSARILLTIATMLLLADLSDVMGFYKLRKL